VGGLSIYDIMLAYNVPAYIVTRKRCALKVTPKWQHRGVESAVYDCLVFFRERAFLTNVKLRAIDIDRKILCHLLIANNVTNKFYVVIIDNA